MIIVLNSYGGSLSRSNSNFLVCNEEKSQIVPVYGVSAIHVWRSNRISTDAIMLALDNDIDIVFMDKKGDVKGRVWNCKFGSIATIRKGQLYFESSPEGVAWIKNSLKEKIEGQLRILNSYETELADTSETKKLKQIEWTKNKMKESIRQIMTLKGCKVTQIATSLRGLEGMASRVYFQALASLTPKELKFRKRQQRPAKDIVNAMLNYGYAILYNRVDNALVKAGIDPAVGLLHVDKYNHPVFTYDVIEPYRFWIDKVVFQMVIGGEVKTTMCEPSEDGTGIWLNDELRKLLSIRITDSLSTEDAGNHGWSKENTIQMDTQRLAQTFKQLYKKNRQ